MAPRLLPCGAKHRNVGLSGLEVHHEQYISLGSEHVEKEADDD